MKQKMIYKKIEEKKEKKKYVAQKQYNWVRKKKLFLYFVIKGKWSFKYHFFWGSFMSPLYYNKTTFPVQANDLSKDWKLRWLHYLFP